MTTTNNRLWILGAEDPEMVMIEKILTNSREPTVHAAVDGSGRRVGAKEAYAKNLTVLPGNRLWQGSPDGDPSQATVYTVECSLPPGMEEAKHVIIDHHRPGDLGFDQPPAKFLSSSSLGQVIAVLARLNRLPAAWTRISLPLLGGTIIEQLGASIDGERWRHVDHIISSPTMCAGAIIPRDVVICAAADHCLAAAYRGECPGVQPDDLMRWRAESRASFQRRTVEDVLADVARAAFALKAAPKICLSNLQRDGGWIDDPADAALVDDIDAATVADVRGPLVPELPEAACRLGLGYVAGPVACPDGRKKVVCSGTREQVLAFMSTWSAAQKLVDVYGDPTRGFAGGFIHE